MLKTSHSLNLPVLTVPPDQENIITIDNLIDRLWETVKHPQNSNVLTQKELAFICTKARSVITAQPVFIELVPPRVVCGDVHGQFYVLRRIFELCGDPGVTNFLFLGDYVDRGNYSVNTVALLFLYKIKYPENFFLLRGNHESSVINKVYGFYEECRKNYRSQVWRTFNSVFEWLPIAAMIDNRILCVHGGISPDLESLDQLRNIKRPVVIPDKGLVCDITWADPEPTCDTWGENDRGTSFVFGEDPAKRILEKFGLDLIVRAHQAVNNGYSFPFTPWMGVVTVFSAPNYSGEFGNAGAVMTINEQNMCRFEVFESKSLAELSAELKRPPKPVEDENYEEDIAVKKFV